VEALINKLIKYGPITMENEYNYWHVGCVVTLPGYSDTSFVKSVNKNLLFAVKEVLRFAEEELLSLKEKSKTKQQKLFDYGYNNKDWTEAH
jgi:hypothetical protein